MQADAQEVGVVATDELEVKRLSSAGSTVAEDLEALEAQEEQVAAPSTEKGPVIHKILFIVMGTAELFVWNAILCILEDVRSKLYPDYHSMSDTLNAVNNITNLGVAVYCVYTGAMNQFWILTSIVVLAASCFSLACVTQWAVGIHGVVWYHLVNLAAGAGCGMFQTGCFGLASALPHPCPGYVSTGQGVSGVATWILWTIISNSSLEVKPAMWALMGCGMGVLSISFAAYAYLVRLPEVNTRVKQIQKTLKEEAHNPDAPKYTFLFKQCWRHCFTIWWNLYVTLFIFPTIGPLGWNTGSFYNYLIGCFQIGDLVGRYTPNLSKHLVIPPVALFWSVIGRTLLVILGLWSYFASDNKFWSHKATMVLIMLILAVTNGWFATSVYINTPKVIKQQDWISRVSAMVTCFLLTGIACGLWTARIFTAIAN